MTDRSTTRGRLLSRAGRAALATGVLAAIACAIVGCDPYVQGNGVFREEPRQVGPFHGVALADGLVATVRAGAEAWSLVVSGDENVLQYVETGVDGNGILFARMVNGVPYDSVHPLRVVVAAPAIDLLRAAEAAAIVASGLAGASLWVEASDGGDVRVSAADAEAVATGLNLILEGGARGGGHLDARAWPVQTAIVELSGGARAELDVRGEITGTARASVIENDGAGVCSVELLDGATCG